MKYTLENRPYPSDIRLNWQKVEKWFEGFEKELREKLVYPTNTKNIAVYDFIKEILGGTKNG